jgi:hypothetical protein
MVDDGSGNGISIPSMLIGMKDGQTIKDFLEDDEGKHNNPSVALMASFDISHPDDRVEWDFWYTSSNKKALEFLKSYHEYNQKLGDKTLFTPHYFFWSCEQCDRQTKREDCFGDGKYCSLDQENHGISGQDIMYENLRQKCLFDRLTKENKVDNWWEYIGKVHAHCYDGITKECSKQVHDKLDMDFEKTQDCVDASFSKNDHTTSLNYILEDEVTYMKKYGPNFFPAAVINNVTYRGSLTPSNFFEAVCQGFKNKPGQCSTKSTHLTIIEGINTSTLVVIILVLVLVNVGIIVLYKKYAKKEMDQKIEMHINSAVSQYFAIQDKSSDSRVVTPYVD